MRQVQVHMVLYIKTITGGADKVYMFRSSGIYLPALPIRNYSRNALRVLGISLLGKAKPLFLHM